MQGILEQNSAKSRPCESSFYHLSCCKALPTEVSMDNSPTPKTNKQTKHLLLGVRAIHSETSRSVKDKVQLVTHMQPVKLLSLELNLNKLYYQYLNDKIVILHLFYQCIKSKSSNEVKTDMFFWLLILNWNLLPLQLLSQFFNPMWSASLKVWPPTLSRLFVFMPKFTHKAVSHINRRLKAFCTIKG